MVPDEQGDLVINGQVYPLWQQFVKRKQEWLGGTLHSTKDEGPKTVKIQTTIRDITLTPVGTEQAAFTVVGEHFSCSHVIEEGFGVLAHGPPSTIWFSGLENRMWGIAAPTRKT